MKALKTTKKVRAIAALVLLCTVLMLALTACGGSDTANYSWNSGENVEAYFPRILKLNAEAREKFVAASRGYDMSAEGFDDSKVDPSVVTEVNLEAAKKALEGVKPTDDASAQIFEQYRAELTADQVLAIVKNMSEEAELDTKNGFFDAILVGIGWFLDKLTFITGRNYVLALFIFAIVVELVLLPFGIKQQKNSIKQATLRPKEMAIRNKYKGRTDQATQQKMNQEIQRLYQEEGFNPMGGCLPLLIQMPIIIALYNIVIDPLHYVLGKAAGLSTALTTYCTTARAAGGLGQTLGSGRGTIELLSKIKETPGALDGLNSFAYFKNGSAVSDALSGIDLPNFNFLGLRTGSVPSIKEPSWLWLVPILTFAFYFASMKLTRKFSYQPVTDPQVGCSNNMMDITMPLMSVYISFVVPAAVGIYWIFKSIISTVKQFVMHKVMPMPVFTEEDYKAAERALKGKQKPEKKSGERTTKDGVKVRSLHHIDDDDEPLPPRTPERDEPVKKASKKAEKPANAEESVKEEEPASAEQETAKEEEKPASGLTAPLKEDRKNADNNK